jgi:hypothetical protein
LKTKLFYDENVDKTTIRLVEELFFGKVNVRNLENSELKLSCSRDEYKTLNFKIVVMC